MPRKVYSGLLDTRRPVNGAPDRDMVTLTVARIVPAGALSGVLVLLGMMMTLVANVPWTGEIVPTSTQEPSNRIQ